MYDYPGMGGEMHAWFAINGEVIINEDGRRVRRIATKKWKAVPIKRGLRSKLSHYLHIKQDNRD